MTTDNSLPGGLADRPPRKRGRSILVVMLIALAAAVLWVEQRHGASPGSAAGGAVQAKQLYTCGMHPQVLQDHPGNCPICGMKLTLARARAGEATIAVDPVTVQNMGIRTATVARGPLRRVIRTVGVMDYDETALAEVTTKYKGWIEKLYASATGQLVMRGDPLFEIYSPELYSAQVEYLLATEPPGGSNSLREAVLAKLKLLDISDDQIAALDRTRQALRTLRVGAPRDGFVVEKMVVEGQMVDAGMKIYRLADLGLVWMQAQIYEQDFMFLKLGQDATVKLDYMPDREFRGRVTCIYPTVDEKTRTVKVRIEFHNPGYLLKPGMFGTVRITSELEPSALLVPDMAVLRSGEKATVFVALGGGTFDPRTVVLGPQAADGMYQVLGGLREGERVVTSGQFMLDSESQLREAIQKMQAPGAAAREDLKPADAAAVRAGPAEGAAPEDAGATKYICPMPEHVSIEYDHPGRCGICNMTLVPVSAATLRMLQPGGTLRYYTCPMPEHAAVREEKAGKCPRCGMTLIPVMEAAPVPGPDAGAGAAQVPLYTCPMESDADVVSDKPGECPKCGMALVLTSKVAHGKVAEANWRKEHPPKAAPAGGPR